jgi:ABC-type antimicrobial peptide transport system permease subunit
MRVETLIAQAVSTLVTLVILITLVTQLASQIPLIYVMIAAMSFIFAILLIVGAVYVFFKERF